MAEAKTSLQRLKRLRYNNIQNRGKSQLVLMPQHAERVKRGSLEPSANQRVTSHSITCQVRLETDEAACEDEVQMTKGVQVPTVSFQRVSEVARRLSTKDPGIPAGFLPKSSAKIPVGIPTGISARRAFLKTPKEFCV